MKKLFMVVVALLYSFLSVNMTFAADDTWIRKADFGGVYRHCAGGFSIGGKGYIGMGASQGGYRVDFWEYDQATNTWTQKADFGGAARCGTVGFSIDNKGYIGTGTVQPVDGWWVKDFWEYDPETNIWTRKADLPGEKRGGAAGFSLGNKGYIGTGNNQAFPGASGSIDFWEYDPATDTWTRKADFGGAPRVGATGFSIENKGYIGIGSYKGVNYKDFWEYDPSNDTWKQKADFGGMARLNAVSFSIGSKGYIGTGDDWSNSTSRYKKDFWEYDPSTDTWTRKADLGGVARSNSVGFSIGNKGYIGTAGTGGYGKDFWQYGSDDTTPDQFIFNYETGVNLSTIVTSNTITVSGIDAPASISIVGGTYSINGGAYTNENGKVNNGDTVAVQQTSSADYSTKTDATLTIGGVSDTFSVTTKKQCIIYLNPVSSRTTLWPPNNKMVPIVIKANAATSDGSPVTLTATVSCNEPAKFGRDWTKPIIIQKQGVILLALRATRLGNGTGRIYTITITATSADGTSVTKAVTVTVPHDQCKKRNR